MITKKNSVWIDHWYDVKIVLISDCRGLKDLFDKVLQCEIRDCFSRMCSSNHNDSLLFTIPLLHCFSHFILMMLLAQDVDGIHVEPWKTYAYPLDMDKLFFCEILKILLEYGLSIGRQSGKVDFLVFLKVVLKLKEVTFFIRIVLISQILPLLMPLTIDGPHKRFHALLIETAFLWKFIDSKFDFAAFSGSHLCICRLTSK